MVAIALLLMTVTPDGGSGCVSFQDVLPQLESYRAANRAAFVAAAADAGLDPASSETLPLVTGVLDGPFVKEGTVEERGGTRVIAGPVGTMQSHIGPDPLLAMRDSKKRLRVVQVLPEDRGYANAATLLFCGCFAACSPRLFVEIVWSDAAAANGCRLAGGAMVRPQRVQHFFAVPRDANVGPPVVLSFPVRRLRAEDEGRSRICPTPP
jgi:hypothetical protein